MKIGVITLHRVRNYGSSLQTLATQNYFEQRGCNVEIVDYYPERYSSFGLLKRLKNKSEKFKKNPLILFCARCVISVSYIKKKIVFDSFLKRYINLTDKTYRNESELLQSSFKADAYCTGSDQVWNSHWNEGVDAPLYLSFISSDSYKFSYSSSIGNSELDSKETDAVFQYLKQYKHITVRENTGVEIIKGMGIDDVQQLLDPTLMFDAQQWSKYTSDRYKNKKYIVTYNLHHDNRIDEYAQKLAKENNLKVYNISYNFHDIIRKGCLKWCPTVEEYLGLIRDAEFVIADSFHATAFSIIFNKKFIIIYPEQASSRLRSILELLNIQDRGTDTIPSTESMLKEIDYVAVNKIIREEQKKTHDYINMILSELGEHNNE